LTAFAVYCGCYIATQEKNFLFEYGYNLFNILFRQTFFIGFFRLDLIYSQPGGPRFIILMTVGYLFVNWILQLILRYTLVGDMPYYKELDVHSDILSKWRDFGSFNFFSRNVLRDFAQLLMPLATIIWWKRLAMPPERPFWIRCIVNGCPWASLRLKIVVACFWIPHMMLNLVIVPSTTFMLWLSPDFAPYIAVFWSAVIIFYLLDIFTFTVFGVLKPSDSIHLHHCLVGIISLFLIGYIVCIPQIFIFAIPFVVNNLIGLTCEYFDTFRVLYMAIFTCLSLAFWSYVGSLVDKMTIGLEPAYVVHRAMQLSLMMTESYMGLISVKIFANLSGSCGVTTSSFAVNHSLLVLAYSMRTIRWTLLQSGVLSYLHVKLNAFIGSFLRCKLRRSAVARVSPLERVPVQASHSEAVLFRDPGRPSCSKHGATLSVIKQEHRIEGLIVAEVCTTIVVIFLVTIQYVFKDCHDPKNLYKSVICVREEAIAAGWTGWWYNTSTAVFSLAFVLLYLPIFWTIRRIHRVRLGQNVKRKLHKTRLGQMSYVAYQLIFHPFLVTFLEERISKWLAKIIQLTRKPVSDCVDDSDILPNLEYDYGKWIVYFFIVDVFFFANVALN
jgi:hypothetical protein